MKAGGGAKIAGHRARWQNLAKEWIAGRQYLHCFRQQLRPHWYQQTYAAIHQFGGTVKAKNKPYLVSKVGDGFRKVKQVHHPRPTCR